MGEESVRSDLEASRRKIDQAMGSGIVPLERSDPGGNETKRHRIKIDPPKQNGRPVGAARR
jgi:hypothetical protein